MSVEYYARLERGEVGGVTEGVVNAVAKALRLDEDEHAYLDALVRAVRSRGAAGRAATAVRAVGNMPVRPGVQQTLGCIGAPALLVNPRTDIVAASPTAHALYVDVGVVGLGASAHVGERGDLDGVRLCGRSGQLRDTRLCQQLGSGLLR